MGGKSGTITVYDYYMSMHVGLCAHRGNTELLNIKIGDKIVWEVDTNGETGLLFSGVIPLEKKDMFGGPKKEGGVKGLAWWMPGGAAQKLYPPLSARFGLTPDTCPAFRGVSTIFLTGYAHDHMAGMDSWWSQISGTSIKERFDLLVSRNKDKALRGLLLASNNPYLKSISARVRSFPVGLNAAYAKIRLHDSSTGRWQYAANPAHIVYEAMTNTDWGMGETLAMFDRPSFEACAVTLFNENFGMNIMWSKQSKIQEFIGEVLDHIQGVIYVDPATGLHTMKLLRADYDEDTLPQINPSNAKISNFKRKVWGELANEVTVTITNTETGQDESYTAQDLGGIATQGGIIPSSKNYYGVCSPSLGMQLAERDLAASVNPIATCDVECSRAFWDTVNSDVVRLSWPKYGIENIVFRVSNVKKSRNKVTMNLYEDIFGLEHAEYLEAGETGWEDPNEVPSPLTNYYIGTAPAFMAVNALGLTDASELTYPEVLSGMAVAPDSIGDIGYDLTTWFADVNGVPYQDQVGTGQLHGGFRLITALVPEVTSVVSINNIRGGSPSAGDFVMLGNFSDTVNEIATVTSVTGNTITLNRGVLDTVPRDWTAGTTCYTIPAATSVQDPTLRSVGETVSYWLQTRTTLGILPLELTPETTVELSDRPYLPLRPADVKVEGVGFGTVDLSSNTTITVTWANRNRVLEATQIMTWNQASVAPEAGQTTSIRLRDSTGTLITEINGLTGTSHTFNKSLFGAISEGRIQVVSKRDSFVSLQNYSLDVTL